MPAAQMLSAFTRMMDVLKLPVNTKKTWCLIFPDEVLEIFGFCSGTNYRYDGRGVYIGTRDRANRAFRAYVAESVSRPQGNMGWSTLMRW